MLSSDMVKEEKEEYTRQIADYKDYIEKVEEEKKLLEADLDHLANELEKFRERGTNYHGTFFPWLILKKKKEERKKQKW